MMKNKTLGKISSILVILLFIISLEAAPAESFLGLDKVGGAIGDMFGGLADWIGKVSSGEIEPGDAIGKVVGGVITGVLTGTYNGLEGALESIMRGTSFDIAYRKAKHNVRLRLDEKYKLESLSEELKNLKKDFNELKKEISDAGCQGVNAIDFGEIVEEEEDDTGGGGGGGDPRPRPTAAERASLNQLKEDYLQAIDDRMGGIISRGELRDKQRAYRALRDELRAKYNDRTIE